MKKTIKRKINRFFLWVLICNSMILHDSRSHPIAIPVFAQYAAVLTNVGVMLVGITAAIFKAENHSGLDIQTTTTIADSIIDSAGSVPVALDAAQAAEHITAQIASQELNALSIPVVHLPAHHVHVNYETGIPIVFKNIPGGVRMEIGNLYLSVQASNRMAENDARMVRTIAASQLQITQHKLAHDAAYRQQVITELRSVIDCMVNVQNGSALDSAPAAFNMRNLHAPSSSLFNMYVHDAAREIQQACFHPNGKLCDKVCDGSAQISKSIITLVDGIVKKSNDTIRVSDLINESVYTELKHHSSHAKTGNKCSDCSWFGNSDMSPVQASEYNRAVVDCFNACQVHDFAKAQELQKVYPHDTFIEKIIAEHKQAYEAVLQRARNAQYNQYGIVKVAENDPAYAAHRDMVHRVEDKTAINNNLLVRHHIKKEMHKKWGISQSAPDYVHEALYEVMGVDGSGIADIKQLQTNVEAVLSRATDTSEYRAIAQAFYSPNGILKDIECKIPEVTHVTMPEQILTSGYAQERTQLNELLYEQLAHTEKTEEIWQTIHKLDNWLNGPPKEKLRNRAEFQDLYAGVFHHDSDRQKEAVVKQIVSEEVDVTVSTSGPPSGPDDPEKKDKNKNKKRSRLGALTEEAKKKAMEHALRGNNKHHIFDKAKHQFDQLIDKLGGCQDRAMQAIMEELFRQSDLLPSYGLEELDLLVEGFVVTVRVFVQEGIPKIGTMFIRG